MANPWDNDDIIRPGPGATTVSTSTTPAAEALADGPRVQQATTQQASDGGRQPTAFWEKDELIRPATDVNASRPQPAALGVRNPDAPSSTSSSQGPAGAQGAELPAAQTPAPAPGLVQRVMEVGKDVGRQVGLTARYGLEGLGQAAEVVTEPLRHLVTDPALRGLGMPEGMPLGQAMTGVADSVGLPKPANETERVVGDAARFMAGGAGVAGGAGAVARVAAPVAAEAAGPLQAAVQAMASNPGMQIAGAAGAGGGAGLAREAGGGEGAQLAAGLAGGLSVSGLVQAARSGIQSASVLVPVQAKRVEQQIEQALGSAGVSWNDVPEGIRSGMRVEAERALRTGQPLDAGALARLLEFKRVGSTPTRGTLTLDPVQITREQNLARTGANSSDAGLQGLARVQNENNRTLIDSLNRLGAGGADDAVTTGERVMGSLQRGLDVDKAGVDALYSQARDSAGRSFPLDGHAFTTQASKLLDDNLLGGALPSSVQAHLNRIAVGEVPFDVNYAEQLKTAIGKLQRASSDGQQRMALGMVRQALDETPVMELGRSGPAAGTRNMGTTQPYAGGTELGEQALDAFNRARLANRTMMQRVESIPGLKAVYDGTATPDDFVQRHVISSSAKVQDTGRLAQELRSNDPQSLEAVRSSLALHLKRAAIGSADDETGRFSASGYNRALLALGPKKLAQFFDKDEIAMLKAVGKVSQYTTVQPVGSAVNNSNSGALLMGRGLDMLDRLSAKVPLLGIGPTVSSISKGMQQSQAQKIARGLVRKPPQQQRGLPSATFGTVIAGTGED